MEMKELLIVATRPLSVNEVHVHPAIQDVGVVRMTGLLQVLTKEMMAELLINDPPPLSINASQEISKLLVKNI
jgi:hypothetical protein